MGIVAFTLFLFGLMLIIIYIAVRRKHKRCSAEVEGKLVKIGRNTSRDIERQVYYYSYTVDGIEYQIKSFDRSSQVVGVGDRCTIWYDPRKPKKAMAYRYSSMKPLNILLIVGLVMLLAAFVLPFIGFAIEAHQG